MSSAATLPSTDVVYLRGELTTAINGMVGRSIEAFFGSSTSPSSKHAAARIPLKPIEEFRIRLDSRRRLGAVESERVCAEEHRYVRHVDYRDGVRFTINDELVGRLASGERRTE